MDALKRWGRASSKRAGLLQGYGRGLRLLLLALLPAGAVADEALAGNEVLHFAIGYRVAEPRSQNVMELGTLYRCQEGYCVDRQEFEGRLNLPLSELPYKHQLQAPYRSPKCQEGPVRMVKGRFSQMASGVKVAVEGNRLWIQVAGRRYVWERDEKVGDAYRLADVVVAQGSESPDQVVGFAFRGQRLKGRLAPSQLQPRYAGDIFHKNTLKAPEDAWVSQPSGLSPERFRKIEGQPVLALSKLGSPEVLKTRRKDLWADNVLVLEPEPESGALVQEYGHDFNGNGCFDERGHNKQILPVMQGGKVVAMVYVEYSPDRLDGVPMLSVGRYYEARKRSVKARK